MNLDSKNPPDIAEHGRDPDGKPVTLDQRLFMQLLSFGQATDTTILVKALEDAEIEGVLYNDINDPTGIGLLTFHEDPDFFVTDLRRILNSPPFSELILKPEFTMLGRTYSRGHESDLKDWLLQKPRRTVINTEWKWAIWYPLRRSGKFVALSPKEGIEILREHGTIGFSFGKADYAHDVRLACYGLDTHDNDFVIGLIGKELYPMSALVQTMRKTRQTSEFLEQLGPFFIGKAIWQHADLR